MKRLLLPLLAALALPIPINALAVDKPFQCLGDSEQSCIDLMVANATCAWIKFENDGEKEPILLALRFFGTLFRDWDTDPFQKKITTDDDEINKRRFDFVESVCPSELDKQAARQFKDKANQEKKRPNSIAIIRHLNKRTYLLTIESTLDAIKIGMDSKKTTTN